MLFSGNLSIKLFSFLKNLNFFTLPEFSVNQVYLAVEDSKNKIISCISVDFVAVLIHCAQWKILF